ncbi:MAG: hypothetical protein GY822_00565 [Deltaproteobacteria bacterium]|nr:hypothetical protein [Deltaproteobacteria bacterium]
MIRINLLPIKEKKKRNRMFMQLIAMGAVLMIAVISILGVGKYYSDRLEEQVDRKAQLKVDIIELKKIIGKVDELDEQTKRLESQLDAIKMLEKAKSGPVRILDALSSKIPKRVWLDSVTEKGGSMTLKGVGLDHADISEFMNTLDKNKYFSNVRLDHTVSKDNGGQENFSFVITCTVNYSA